MQKLYGWGLPFDASVHGAGIDHLIYIVHIFMAVLFIGWFIFLVTALWKFRARPGHKAVYEGAHSKLTTYLEIGVAIFEVALLLGFSFPLMNLYRNQLPSKADAMEIRVVAEQFAWNVHYPGADGKFGKTKPDLMGAGNPVGLDKTDPAAQDDVVAINQLHIPVNKSIIVHLTSKDVIHSFYLPVMRVKQDVVPGQEIPVGFEAAKTGKFEIACAQLCGLGHYRMRGFFFVDTPEDFNKWFQGLVKK